MNQNTKKEKKEGFSSNLCGSFDITANIVPPPLLSCTQLALK